MMEMGESINWLNIIIGIMGALFAIYIWFYDRKNMRKATLYFPLFLTCHDLIKVIENHEVLGEDRSRRLLFIIGKRLDEIVYEIGSIIHLKKLEDLYAFLSIKKTIDEYLELIEKADWLLLKEFFINDDFKNMKINAKILLTRCKKEIKIINKIG